jgi:hypothetical protein
MTLLLLLLLLCHQVLAAAGAHDLEQLVEGLLLLEVQVRPMQQHPNTHNTSLSRYTLRSACSSSSCSPLLFVDAQQPLGGLFVGVRVCWELYGHC